MVDLQPAWRPQYYVWSVCQRHGRKSELEAAKTDQNQKAFQFACFAHPENHLFQGCHISDDMEEVVGHMAGVRVRVIRISWPAPLGWKVSYRNQAIQVCMYMIRISSRTICTVTQWNSYISGLKYWTYLVACVSMNPPGPKMCSEFFLPFPNSAETPISSESAKWQLIDPQITNPWLPPMPQRQPSVQCTVDLDVVMQAGALEVSRIFLRIQYR